MGKVTLDRFPTKRGRIEDMAVSSADQSHHLKVCVMMSEVSTLLLCSCKAKREAM